VVKVRIVVQEQHPVQKNSNTQTYLLLRI
jgi:hypothetical protein